MKIITDLARGKSLLVKKCLLNGQSLNNHKWDERQFSLFFSNKTENILKNFPGMVSWKNNDLTFLGCNQRLALLGNLKSSNAIIGKNDSDMPWGANEYIHIFRGEDREVLSGVILYTLTKYKFVDKDRLVLVKKIPILNKSKYIVGIFNYFIEFYKESFSDVVLTLNGLGIEITPRLANDIKFSFFQNKVQLSPREEECSYYLLQGLSAKEIGRIMKLSYRTVEAHLTNLKEKLECKKTSSLIVRLIELGYLDNIPNSMLF